MQDEPTKKSWFGLITDGILGQVGPGTVRSEVNRKDQHKIAGPASAKNVVLNQPNTTDLYGAVERLKPKS